MPHPLRHGPIVYNGHLRGHSHLLPSVWQWSYHYLFLRLMFVATGDRTPIFRMRGNALPLRYCGGIYRMYLLNNKIHRNLETRQFLSNWWRLGSGYSNTTFPWHNLYRYAQLRLIQMLNLKISDYLESTISGY